MSFVQRFPLISFYLLAYGFTWLITVPLMLAKRGVIGWDLPHGLEAVAAFGPFAAAVIALGLTQGRGGIARLGDSLQRWRVAPRWFAFTVLSPLAVLVAALIISGELNAALSTRLLEGLAYGAFFEILIIGGLAQGFGEEPGWRGFALPFLRGRYGPLLATLALYPVWLFWHLPVFLARPEFDGAAFAGFSVGIFAAAIWCTRIYDATRSVLMVCLWHSLINAARSIALIISTSAVLVFGQIVLAVALVTAVVWLWKRRGPYEA